MFTHSIRWRLQLWLGFLLICVLSGFGVTVYQLHRMNQFTQIDDDLERRVEKLSGALRRPPPFAPPFNRRSDGHDGPGRPDGHDGRERPDEAPRRPPPIDGSPDSPRPDGPPDSPRLGGPGLGWRGPREFHLPSELTMFFDETGTNSFYYTLWTREGTPLKTSTNAPAEIPIPAHARHDTRTYTRLRGSLREAFHFTEMGDCVLVGRSIQQDLTALRKFALWLVSAGATVLALGCGGGWWLASRAIRPIEEISITANRISAGNLSERIHSPDVDNELGQLAAVLNSTFARLESAFSQQKQFTADAAHELRTPLAVLISEVQTTLARERTAPEYRESFTACLEAAQQMKKLTESLLDLARAEAGQQDAGRGEIDLAVISGRCVDHLQNLAQKSGLRVDSHLESANALANSERLAQVITNLLANAIYYNKPDGHIEIATRIEDGSALLEVADSGQGIGPEDLPHVFDRFYRADKSRSRSAGHAGLGLAICKSIVEAEGGTIEITSELAVGTRVTVRLPARV